MQRSPFQIASRPGSAVDAGTHNSLLQASTFVQVVEERQNMMIPCPVEIACRLGYIGREELRRLGQAMRNNEYGNYLIRLAAAAR